MFNPRERHYSVQELATSWNVSPDTIRRAFRDEPEVVKIYRQRSGVRVHITLRIPQSVVERVLRQWGGQ
jgi:DeoR/GlpR family transcriptional regulator of sugar metabolism